MLGKKIYNRDKKKIQDFPSELWEVEWKKMLSSRILLEKFGDVMKSEKELNAMKRDQELLRIRMKSLDHEE